jgi:hypothetical protein
MWYEHDDPHLDIGRFDPKITVYGLFPEKG